MMSASQQTEARAAGIGQGPLCGKVVVVTGAASGIGRETALALATAGARLVAVDRSADGLEETLRTASTDERRSDPPHLSITADVRREDDMAEMAEQAMERFGRIDVLVACAGILRANGRGPASVANTTVPEWQQVIDTNLTGVFLSNRAVLPAMTAQRCGSIVNLSSISGRVGRAFDASYCASKFGVIGFSESLAEEVRPYGIRVQAVLPDAVDTPLWQQNGQLPSPAAALPPERVARLIVFLLSLPEDTVLVCPTIAPFQTRRRRPGQAADLEGS
jgi:3-oxoacyl-[acyl-carrier protein] reductase